MCALFWTNSSGSLDHIIQYLPYLLGLYILLLLLPINWLEKDYFYLRVLSGMTTSEVPQGSRWGSGKIDHDTYPPTYLVVIILKY
jgi:hypothetical protein